MSLLTTLLTQDSTDVTGGDVIGPGSSSSHGIASFSDGTGKNIESRSTITVGANNTLTGTGSNDVIIISPNNQNIQLSAGSSGDVQVNSPINIIGSVTANGLNIISDVINTPLTTSISNGSNSAGSSANLSIVTAGPLAGNPTVGFGTGTSLWATGVDNTTQNFVIASGATLGINPYFTINQVSGIVSLPSGIETTLINGSSLSLTTSNATTPSDISITGGNVTSGDNQGASVNITTGDGNGSGPSGNVNIFIGNSGATADGSSILLVSGGGGATSGNAGDIVLSCGSATSGDGGNIVLAPGSGGGGGITGQVHGSAIFINSGQPAFLAYLASNATSATGNGANYTLGTAALTEVFDRGSNFNTNGTFTAPVTGVYQLHATASFGSCTVATTFAIQIVTSNRTYSRQEVRAAGSGNWSINYSTLADMDAADTATVVVTVIGEAGNSVSVLGASSLITSFSGNLVC